MFLGTTCETVVVQTCIYTTCILQVARRSSNPFISEIVLTAVTVQIASRFTKEHLQLSFLSSSQKMITITKFSPLVAAVRVGAEPPERIISLSILYLSWKQTRGLADTHIPLTSTHTLEKVHTNKHTHTPGSKVLSQTSD